MKKYLLLLLLGIIPFSFNQTFAINTTALNQTMASMEPFLEYPNTLNIFYPVFLLVMLCLFMAAELKLRNEQWASVFSIGSVVLCIFLSFVFLAPTDFVYSAENTKVTVEEIEWAGTNNVTYNTILVKDSSNVIIISKSDQFRFTIGAIFGGLMIFNALFAILILTGINKNRRP